MLLHKFTLQHLCEACYAVQTNIYRLGLITHLQAEAVPLKSVQCLRDLQRMYEAATVEDVMQAYHQIPVDDGHIFTCIGTSGPNPLPEAGKAVSVSPLPAIH